MDAVLQRHWQYAGGVESERGGGKSFGDAGEVREGFVRDPFADPAGVADLRRRPMGERLELALSWNKLACELRAGMRAAQAERERD